VRLPESLIDLAGLEVGAEQFLGAVLETVAQPIWVVDRDGVIRFANPAAIAALGYEREHELLGRHSHATIHHSHPDGTPYPADECPMLLPRVTGETVSRDLDWFFRRDGSMFRVSYVSVPIELREGRGAVVAFTDIEDRLRAEDALRAHDELLAGQQASLHRVAALVAGGAASAEVFAAIAREVADVVGVPMVALWRFEPGGTATVIGEWSDRAHPFRVGSRWPLDGPTITSTVLASGRPERIEDFTGLPGTVAGAAVEAGIGACAGAPIIVDGRTWGVMSADTFDRASLPVGVQDRLAEFTALVGAAISNSASREAIVRLADEQAALRRVATLVARECAAEEVFAAIAEEFGRLMGVDHARMWRFENGTAMTVASAGEFDSAMPVGLCEPLYEYSLAGRVHRTGRSQRVDDYAAVGGPTAARALEIGVGCAVATPIVVEGRLWGAMVAASRQPGVLPADAEARMDEFTELMATAIANTESRAKADRLAEEQAALRRVATLVAEGASPTAVFEAVAAEVEGLLDADGVALSRYDPRDELTVVAHHGAGIDDSARTADVAAPIMVDGRLWGVIEATWTGEESRPADTEERLAKFAELLDTAIANADSRDQLTASRVRLVTEGDEARRRVVRDLHDGAQQRLVHTIVTLKLAQRALRRNDPAAASLVGEALDQAEQGNAELRELAHGILPAVLTRGGLRAGIDAVVTRLDLPVHVDVPARRLPSDVEASAYFIVAEALTNVVKHASARRADVSARVEGTVLRVEVRDDGIGGADPQGHGLVGIGDRVTALGGRLTIESPAGGGTLLCATLPLSSG
jgi:PAS domain S-box-containing protein